MDREEKAGSKDILGRLSYSELNELKDTITRKQISAYGRKECINAIVAYSESASELLHRKKLKRDILFQYLFDNQIFESVNSSKDDLVKSIIKFWKSRSQHEKQEVVPTVQADRQPQRQMRPVHQSEKAKPQDKQGRQPHSQEVAPINVSVTVNVVPEAKSPAKVAPMSEQVGEAFITWFYKMLNSQNPMTPNVPEDFGSHHFWPDVNFKLLCLTPQPLEEEITGADLTTQRLLALVRDEQLLFNPNISSEGLKIKSNPHGQLVLIVCGTVHRSQDCLGEFEQLFGLLRDPRFDNNWKVKFTRLRIRSSQMTAMPKLTDQALSEVTALIPV
ncbi:uncharacterized protein C3orf38 homolog [Pecten maximus]|uniref:uncharacterized protein C3orf38 homolog n=1 Tax=Pecten maximus TaxID=6579 RepID=UPI001458322B|nr:uncharacterized protein C3orf38 homolog [Pecten maximus]